MNIDLPKWKLVTQTALGVGRQGGLPSSEFGVFDDKKLKFSKPLFIYIMKICSSSLKKTMFDDN